MQPTVAWGPKITQCINSALWVVNSSGLRLICGPGDWRKRASIAYQTAERSNFSPSKFRLF